MVMGNDAGMSARLKGRRRAVNALLVDVERWAAEHDDVKAVALVVLWRGAERMASDLDLMILADDANALANEDWFGPAPPRRAIHQSRQLGGQSENDASPTVRPHRTEFRERELADLPLTRHSTRPRRRPPNPVRHRALRVATSAGRTAR